MLASRQLLMELPDVGIGQWPSISDELEYTFQGAFMVLEYRDDFLGRLVRSPVRYEARFDPLLDQNPGYPPVDGIDVLDDPGLYGPLAPKLGVEFVENPDLA